MYNVLIYSLLYGILLLRINYKNTYICNSQKYFV